MEIRPPNACPPPAGIGDQPSTPPAQPGLDAAEGEFARLVQCGEGESGGGDPLPGPQGGPDPRKIDDPFRLLAEHPADPTVFKKPPLP